MRFRSSRAIAQTVFAAAVIAVFAPRPALVAQQAAQQAAPPQMPPPFPRPGTTKVLENDAVAVWNVSWLKQQYPLHTHQYDLVGVSYADGDRIITQGSAPGRLVHTKAWEFQINRANVTHVEEGASDPPLRAILIEVKSAAPRPAAAEPADGLRQVAGAPAWDTNNRAAAWVFPAGSSAPMHRHVGDAVELTFDSATPPTPKAAFVQAGTVHAGPTAPDGGRAIIFEIK